MAKHGDRSLLVRMLLAAVLTPLFVVALLVAVILALPGPVLVGVLAALALGLGVTVRQRGRTAAGTVLGREAAPELFATVERLCLAADLPRPEIVLEPQPQPNSWIVQMPGMTPRLHVTKALLDLLEPEELQAVLAHELSHVANHDAAVMTVVGMPGALLLTGARRAARGGWLPMQIGALIAGLIGLCSRVGTSSLSRSRELVADRGACAITGPAIGAGLRAAEGLGRAAPAAVGRSARDGRAKPVSSGRRRAATAQVVRRQPAGPAAHRDPSVARSAAGRAGAAGAPRAAGAPGPSLVASSGFSRA